MTLPDLLKLSGIAIVLVGLAFRLRPTLVVVTAALVTGLASGMPLFTANEKTGIIDMLGRGFADNRLMTLFIITLPAIGLAERYGLQQQSAVWIRRIHAATAGRLSGMYQLFRVIVGALGLRLGGHASFVRPLILPMAIGATEADGGKVSGSSVEKIKAATAASENYGNFYGQNLAPVQAGILLVYGVMKGLGYEVSLWDLVKYTVPVVAASLILGFIQFALLDRDIRRDLKRQSD
jgi:uncharacterized membrane protein